MVWDAIIVNIDHTIENYGIKGEISCIAEGRE